MLNIKTITTVDKMYSLFLHAVLLGGILYNSCMRPLGSELPCGSETFDVGSG